MPLICSCQKLFALEEQETLRRNGFQRPLHPLQLASWIVFTLDCCLFLWWVFPVLLQTGGVVWIALGFLVWIAMALMIVSVFLATEIDPADGRVTISNRIADDEYLVARRLSYAGDRTKERHVKTKMYPDSKPSSGFVGMLGMMWFNIMLEWNAELVGKDAWLGTNCGGMWS